MRNISDKSCRENQNTLCVQHLFFLSRAFYKIMWKNMVVPERSHDNIIGRMRVACWIPKGTDTNPEYGIRIALPRFSGYVYTYIICVV